MVRYLNPVLLVRETKKFCWENLARYLLLVTEIGDIQGWTIEWTKRSQNLKIRFWDLKNDENSLSLCSKTFFVIFDAPKPKYKIFGTFGLSYRFYHENAHYTWPFVELYSILAKRGRTFAIVRFPMQINTRTRYHNRQFRTSFYQNTTQLLYSKFLDISHSALKIKIFCCFSTTYHISHKWFFGVTLSTVPSKYLFTAITTRQI